MEKYFRVFPMDHSNANTILTWHRVVCKDLKFVWHLWRKLFIILAISSSSLIILSSSANVIFEELDPLSLKNGLTLFQKSLLSEPCLTFKLLKYSFLVLREMFKQRLRWRLCLYQLIWFPSLKFIFEFWSQHFPP